MSLHQAFLLRQWSSDVTLFPDKISLTTPTNARDWLPRGVTVADGSVSGLIGERGELRAVELDNGQLVPSLSIVRCATFQSERHTSDATRVQNRPYGIRGCRPFRRHQRSGRLGRRQRRRPSRPGNQCCGGRFDRGNRDQRISGRARRRIGLFVRPSRKGASRRPWSKRVLRVERLAAPSTACDRGVLRRGAAVQLLVGGLLGVVARDPSSGSRGRKANRDARGGATCSEPCRRPNRTVPEALRAAPSMPAGPHGPGKSMKAANTGMNGTMLRIR